MDFHKLILMFTKINRIDVWEAARYFPSMSCLSGTVQFANFSSKSLSTFQQLLSLEAKIVPGKRQRKWWLRSGSAAVWQQHQLPAASISELAPGQGHQVPPCSQQVTHEGFAHQKPHPDLQTISAIPWQWSLQQQVALILVVCLRIRLGIPKDSKM